MEKDGNGPTAIFALTPQPPVATKKKRNGRRMGLFRAIALMFRSNSSKKSAMNTAAMVDPSTIKTLISTVRPLDYQIDYRCSHRSPPPPPPPPPGMMLDSYHDVHQPPPSPECMSRYTSAEDLRALDTAEEENDGDDNGAIDTKAEEFIAMFYKQMKSDAINMGEESER